MAKTPTYSWNKDSAIDRYASRGNSAGLTAPARGASTSGDSPAEISEPTATSRGLMVGSAVEGTADLSETTKAGSAAPGKQTGTGRRPRKPSLNTSSGNGSSRNGSSKNAMKTHTPARQSAQSNSSDQKEAATPSAENSASKPIGKSTGADAVADSKATTLMPLDIEVPAEIEHYVVGPRLGSGTCGVVHKALDNVLGREVAIKISPVGEAHVSTGKVPGAQRAYQTEVYAAGRLRHPNIVTVHDSGQSEDLNYLVMEAIDGFSLKQYGKGQTLLPAYRALEVICDCCKALDYSHRQGILHRDIKPANVMIGHDGSVKLLDFGIAVGLGEDSGLNRTGPTLGTPNYMSPEQILGRTLSPASDFYSLGTVLFELLTGKQLFKAKKVKDLFRTVVHQPAPELFSFRKDLSKELSEVLAKVLKKNPTHRYQSGMEMIAALTPFISHFKVIETLPDQHRGLLPSLSKLPFFNSVSDAEIALLLTEATIRRAKHNEELLAEGNRARKLLLLIDGAVSISSEAGSLRRIYGPGECAGEQGFIHGIHEKTVCHAVTDQSVIELETATLGNLPPKLHLHYYKQISDMLLSRMAREQFPFAPDMPL